MSILHFLSAGLMAYLALCYAMDRCWWARDDFWGRYFPALLAGQACLSAIYLGVSQ